MNKPTSKRKEREKEARRETILDAAARIFSQKSYNEATLDEIAAEAELAKGTLYNYFADKQDLFSSLLQRGLEEFLDAIGQPVDTEATPAEFVRTVFETILAVLAKNKYMERMVMTSGGHLTEKFRNELIRNWQQAVEAATWTLADSLGHLPEISTVSRDERYAASVMILSSAHAIYHRRLPSADSTKDGLNVDLYVTMICRAMQTEKRA